MGRMIALCARDINYNNIYFKFYAFIMHISARLRMWSAFVLID